MYYIGINCSGTYSRLVAVGDDGKIVGRHAGNSICLSKLPLESVKDNLKRLIIEFGALTKTKLSDCAAMCVGISELGAPFGQSLKVKSDIDDNRFQCEKLLRELEVECPVRVVTDAECMLASETKAEPGILIYSGQSAYAYGVDNHGNLYSAGGYGSLIDDVGSAYWMGMEAVKCAILSYEERIQSTVLVDKLKNYFKVEEITDIAGIIYSRRFSRSVISEISMIIKLCSIEKDTVCGLIEEQAAKSLSSLAKSLIKSMKNDKLPIVLSGSVLMGNPSVSAHLSSFIKKEFPKTTVTVQKDKSEMGAAHLAAAIKHLR